MNDPKTGFCRRHWTAAYWFFRTIPRPLIVLVCAAIVALIPIYGINIYQAANGIKPEPWQVLLTPIERLSLSFLASFIFYLVLVHYTNRKDRRVIEAHLFRMTQRIVGQAHRMFKDMASKSNTTIADKLPNDAALQEICTPLTMLGEAPLINAIGPNNTYTYANWLQYFEFIRSNIDEIIDDLFNKMIYMDRQHVVLLTDLRQCSLLDIPRQLLRATPHLHDGSLSVMCKDFAEFRDRIIKLDEYAQEHFHEYLATTRKLLDP